MLTQNRFPANDATKTILERPNGRSSEADFTAPYTFRIPGW